MPVEVRAPVVESTWKRLKWIVDDPFRLFVQVIEQRLSDGDEIWPARRTWLKGDELTERGDELAQGRFLFKSLPPLGPPRHACLFAAGAAAN
jgi:hypothetical protein